MLKLNVVQAEHGDCLILEYGAASNPRYILVDGGPATIYQEHLQARLLDIRASGGKLDLVILSHVDDDHVVGLLDLMTELRQQRGSGAPETVAIEALWHNTFSQTLGPEVEDRFRVLMRAAITQRGVMAFSDRAEKSIGQGDELTRLASALHIPINPGLAPRRLICLDEVPAPVVLDNLSARVVGPTRRNLKKLRTEWLEWLEKHERHILVRDPILAERAAREADQSVPNLSSIMVLAEADEKRVLLTGDGRGDDLVRGLKQANLLDPAGRLHVNVLKLPHHGSKRNVSKRFFQTVTADTYVISANGRDGNPDLDTLKWIVEAAREGGRAIQIVVTNATESTRQLVEEYDPGEYGYRLIEMESGAHAMILELAT